MASEQAEQQPPPTIAARRCRNCGAPLTGRYCADCSQAGDVHVPSTRELLHQVLEGITHSDSRLWTTLYSLWFKPGKLTLEFVAGRRVAYLPPFRLYLILSVIFFMCASLSPHGDVVRADDAASVGTLNEASCADANLTALGSYWEPRARHACTEIVRDKGANLLHVAIAAMPKAMFIFLPLLAFLHMLMYWRPRHRYAEHLLFFLHVHSFFFSVMTLAVLSADAADVWPGARNVSDFVALLLWLLPLYLVLAMKRVFGKSWARTLAKAAALFAVYMVLIFITLAGVFVYAGLQL
jgi:hypothetical protein